jgi:hypothetical protein
MEITKSITDTVVVAYTVTQDEWTYMDSMYFSKEEYDAMTPGGVDEIIEEKFNEWLSYVTA